MELQGEYLDAAERVIVSPAAGVFVPAPSLPPELEAGATVGVVRTGADEVPVVSPFGGRLVALVASAGERLTLHQRVAWLRAG